MSEIRTVAVVGAGATGAYLAAELTDAGLPVTLVARGASLAKIRSGGIEVRRPDGTTRVARPAQVVGVTEVSDPVDLVLFCVKTYDTVAATRLVEPLLRTGGYVLCLQNGVKNEQLLADVVGGSNVLSGVLYIGSQRAAPGVIVCSSLPRIVIGPYEGAGLVESRAVKELFDSAGIECTVDPQVGGAKWQKFLFNCGLNPMTAITGRRMAQLLAEPATAGIFHALVDEAAAVAVAAGAPLPDGYRANVTAIAQRMDISSSMAEDLNAGRALELDAFTGYVIALGESTGTPTPSTKVVHGILTALDADHRVTEGV